MRLHVKTKDIELEYQDEYSIIEEAAKTRLLTILDKVFEKQSMLEASKPIIPNQDWRPIKCKYCGGEDKGQ
tara:strand:+ start:460 stop:672 length:213 start_codon:yes stop_codon:yes gene_type:complete